MCHTSQQFAGRTLLDQQTPFDEDARKRLLIIMCEAFDGLLARYSKLAKRGQIELSMTPYGHPIVPLLLDLDAMHGALPEAEGPASAAYPGGEARARWHMQEGLRVFKKHLGSEPQGVWLSEGGVSEAALELLDEFGIRWSASGEGVWNNSRFLSKLPAQGDDGRRSLFSPNAVGGCDARMFFRDDGLSDLIGFEYQQWDAVDAAADFNKHLGNIGTFLGEDRDQHVVSVILDGENAWEYYPDNAFHFLGALYDDLVANIRAGNTKTFNETQWEPSSWPQQARGVG